MYVNSLKQNVKFVQGIFKNKYKLQIELTSSTSSSSDNSGICLL